MFSKSKGLTMVQASIYNSRNFLCFLNLKRQFCGGLSTIVEIFYVF